MLIYRILFGLFLFAGMIGCTCDDNIQCPPLTQNSIHFLESMILYGDTIYDANADSEVIQFNGQSFRYTLDNLQPCKSGEMFKCNCDYPCESYGYLSYLTDSMAVGLTYSINEEWYKGKIY